ncbi:phosphatase PAP2 family protein [Vasconcelosia minhoensis]|uniref:phosphatase PAP2 family protein n=1 Tax=Vasconcelosia minhoensis TaxID=3366354 RepID=UPI002AD3E610|nr:phosphatase PAP2 family protein [Romeria gracilis]
MGKSRSVVPAGISAIAHRFWQKSQQIPAEAWRRWGGTLAIGLGILALLTYATTRLAMGWQDPWLQDWDRQTLIAITERFPMTFAKGVTWESPGNLVGMLPMILTFTALTAWFANPLIAASAVAAYVLQFALVWISWGMWDRDRPDLIADGLAAPGLHSFPSGHATVVMATYGFLFYLWLRTSRSWLERFIALSFSLVWIGLISMARLILGTHWTSDIIAGLALGGLWLLTVVIAMERGLGYVRRSQKRQSG